MDIILLQKSGDELSTNSYAVVFSDPAPTDYDGPMEALNENWHLSTD